MSQVNTSLSDSDPEIFDIVEREKNRQVRTRPLLEHLQRCSLTSVTADGAIRPEQMTGLQLIPSEVRAPTFAARRCQISAKCI